MEGGEVVVYKYGHNFQYNKTTLKLLQACKRNALWHNQKCIMYFKTPANFLFKKTPFIHKVSSKLTFLVLRSLFSYLFDEVEESVEEKDTN